MLRFLTRLALRPYRPRRAPAKSVAIVVPMSTRATLDADEETSLRHLQHYLGEHDKFFVAPPDVALDRPGFRVRRFPRKFFGSAAAHARLLYSAQFYRAFEDYRFIFFYHLDSLVFSDELERWCATDLDYIGPPWLQCPDTPWVEENRVGNGGFALLRVESALRALYARYRKWPSSYWLDLFARNGHRLGPLISLLRRLERAFPTARMFARPLREWEAMQNPGPHNRNTDIFWADKAVAFWPKFKVASFEEGLRFGFEAAPRLCFELNERRIPFGCHAWTKFDRSFWEPHLLR